MERKVIQSAKVAWNTKIFIPTSKNQRIDKLLESALEITGNYDQEIYIVFFIPETSFSFLAVDIWGYHLTPISKNPRIISNYQKFNIYIIRMKQSSVSISRNSQAVEMKTNIQWPARWWRNATFFGWCCCLGKSRGRGRHETNFFGLLLPAVLFFYHPLVIYYWRLCSCRTILYFPLEAEQPQKQLCARGTYFTYWDTCLAYAYVPSAP